MLTTTSIYINMNSKMAKQTKKNDDILDHTLYLLCLHCSSMIAVEYSVATDIKYKLKITYVTDNMITVTLCNTCIQGIMNEFCRPSDIQTTDVISFANVYSTIGISSEFVISSVMYRLIQEASDADLMIASCNGRNSAYISVEEIRNIFGKSSKFLSIDSSNGKKLQYLQGGFL